MTYGESERSRRSAGRRVRIGHRRQRHLQQHRYDALRNAECLRFAGELFANQFRLVLATAPGTARQKKALAREMGRTFHRALRKLRQQFDAYHDAVLHLELARGSSEQLAAERAQMEAAERLLAAFSGLAALPEVTSSLTEGGSRSGSLPEPEVWSAAERVREVIE